MLGLNSKIDIWKLSNVRQLPPAQLCYRQHYGHLHSLHHTKAEVELVALAVPAVRLAVLTNLLAVVLDPFIQTPQRYIRLYTTATFFHMLFLLLIL